MRWISALSEEPRTAAALNECVRKAMEAGGGPPDLAILFPSAHHSLQFKYLPEALAKALNPKRILGCSAGGIIAGGREVEHRPALGLTAAWLPDVDIRPFHVEQDAMPDPDARPAAWRDWIGVPPSSDKPCFLLFSDPFSLNPEDMAAGLDFAFPGSVKIGGLASGAQQPGGNALYMDGQVFSSGAVGAALTGNVALDPIVAQGCRPVGTPLQVTRCERNLLLELDGKPTLEVLEKILEAMPEGDRQLARTSLFLGLLNDPLKSGDDNQAYLIRNLIGLDPDKGILAIGAMLRPGQTVQFHLRDKKTSAQDLEEHLSRYLEKKPSTKPEGALLFSCLGRGEHLYRKPNHDTDLFLKKLGPLAVGGFFCNGEIGPVDGTTYLHGYTSCFGIFRPIR